MPEAEHAEPGQVDRGGEQGEVGGDLDRAADAGASAAVVTPHQMPDLAFDLGSGGAVVGLPGGVGLCRAGTGELGLLGGDRDGAPGGRGGALRNERAAGAGGPERGDTATFLTGRIAILTCPGQVTLSAAMSMVKRSLANRRPSAGGGCTLVIIRAPAFSSLASSGPAP